MTEEKKEEEVEKPKIVKEKTIAPINQWAALNNVLRLYKIIGGALTALCAVLVASILIIAWRPPVVVIKEAQDITHYMGAYKAIELNERTIEKVVRRFIKFRYVWDSLDPNRIAKGLVPITTKGVGIKVKKGLKELKFTSFKEREVQQSVTNIKVKVTKKKVMATFDKILTIEGLPLPVPTLIYLQIIQGSPTYWNPEGLYVNGVIEKQGG